MPFLGLCEVTEIYPLSAAVYKLALNAPEIVSQAVPGQFLHLGCGQERILRRPISICDVSADRVTLIFEVKGSGTRWLSERQIGDRLDVLGPLGSGFDIADAKRLVVVGGGLGVPPILYAAKSARGSVTAVLGFRDKSRIILKPEFEQVCEKVYITTDDGSYGAHGAVTGTLQKLLTPGDYDVVLACGPRVMLRAVYELAKANNTSCQVSLEERMGCGVGACLVCSCATVTDGVKAMRRVCKDGPVFDAKEVEW